MTVAAYAHDLTDIIDCDSAPTYIEFTTMTQGGTGSQDTDYFIQGTACASATTTKTGLSSIGYDYGGGITIPAGSVVLYWHWHGAPNCLETLAAGGMRAVIGSAAGAWNAWIVGGRDFAPNPYGGWINTAVDPTVSVDYTYGSPSSTKQFYGIAVNLSTAPSRGNLFAMDCVRYGRGTLTVTYGEAANYGTFAGMATFNDLNAVTYRRLGLFKEQGGTYLWKGKIALGTSGTVVDFRDSNRVIFIDDTRKVSSTFNAIEVDNASSRVDWTNISIKSLGTTAPGTFTMLADADLNMESCTFTSMGAFVFDAASTINDSTFRTCGQITTGGATMDGCTFDQSSAATCCLCAQPAEAALISNASFTSDGTGHAIEVSGTAANFTLTNVSFSGYAAGDGDTGNEAVYVNIAGGSLNLTVSTTPSVRTAGCAVTVVTSSRTVRAYAKTAAGTAIENANLFLAASSGTGSFPVDASVTIVNAGTLATVTHTTHGLASNDQVFIEGASLDLNNGVFTITKTDANTYTYTMSGSPGSSPTGSITSTFVFLKGLTNASGYVTMSRSIPADQTVTGWARKSSAAPYYKTGTISGTVSSTANTTFTAVLTADE